MTALLKKERHGGDDRLDNPYREHSMIRSLPHPAPGGSP